MTTWKVEDGREGEEEKARDQEPGRCSCTLVDTWTEERGQSDQETAVLTSVVLQ